jgi:Domain of unknown function (DUF4394)/Calx-beta domain/Bacterial Ig domain
MSTRATTLIVGLCLFVAPRLASAERLFALTADNHLESFDTSAPGQMLSRVPITGLDPGTTVLAIDVRPSDRQIYALGSVGQQPSVEGRLYRVNASSGVATPIGASSFVLPSGGEVGFDVDPVLDQVRIVTDEGVNFRVHPDLGTIIDGQPDPGHPGTQTDTLLTRTGIVALAYQPNSSTTLYALDAANNLLVKIGQVSPNDGVVTTIGPLEMDVPEVAGLDMDITGIYAVLRAAPEMVLARLDVSTGKATTIGVFARPTGGDTAVRDIALLHVGIAAYALTQNDHLLLFKTHQPDIIAQDLAITGLGGGETLLGIEGDIYSGIFGLTNLGRLVAINVTTGGASDLAGFNDETLSGTISPRLGITIDPATNVIRIVDDAGRNVTADIDVSYQIDGQAIRNRTALQRTGIAAIAYTSRGPNGEAATLYGIDATTDALVRIGGPNGAPSPNEGAVTVVGPLGINVDGNVAFDIDPSSNVGYLTRHDPTHDPDYDELYIVDLSTGAATIVGNINTPKRPLKGLAFTLPGTVSIQTEGFISVNEKAGNLVVTVERRGTEPFSVDYATTPGTAQAGADYTSVSGTLTFHEFQAKKTITIPIIDDGVTEFDFERFTLSLSNPTAGMQLDRYYPSTAIIIVDPDAPPNAKPTATITTPTSSDTYEAHSRFVSVGGTAADDRGVSQVYWYDNHGNEGLAQGTTNWVIPSYELPNGTTTITVRAQDALAVASDPVKLTITLVPASFTSLLAEGATGGFFDLDILLANPEGQPVDATLTFLKEDATTVTHTRTLPPLSRTTVRVDEIPGMESTTTSTVVTSAKPIVVERTMRWGNGQGYGAHTEKAVDGPSRTWYFAEGSQGFFFTYLLLANPQTTANTATVEYLREGAVPITRTYPLAPLSRFTVDAGADPELRDRSFGMVVTFAQPGVAERAMYFGLDPLWKAGHESAGVTLPSTTWFLAEGATGPFFETFILLANPLETDAQVTATYLLQGGAPVTKTYTVPARGRTTINIEGEDPTLSNAAVATRLESTGPIVAERAQYWPYGPFDWYEAHNSFGVIALDRYWGLAEGRVGGDGNYETYILLANPGTEAAEVEITFLRTTGQPVVKAFTVPPASRLNISTGAGGPIPELQNEEFSVVIASTEPIAVERAMYSSVGGITWSAGTNATGTRIVPIE